MRSGDPYSCRLAGAAGSDERRSKAAAPSLSLLAPPTTLAPLPSSRITDICLLVEEGVANAMRHGSAKAVEITLAPRIDGNIALTIVDDGVGPTDGSPGLGSSIFNQASTMPWTLTPRSSGSGSVLQVVVAIAPSIATAAI